MTSKSFDLETFTFNGKPLRHVFIDGEPWFLATDVCHLLGYAVTASGVNHYLLGLRKDEDRKTLNTRTLGVFEGIVGERGNPMRTFITEKGLYTVIMRAQSTREGVEEFQTWVTKEVLPRIRKNGGYVKDVEKVETGEVTAKVVQENLWMLWAATMEAVRENFFAPLLDPLLSPSRCRSRIS